MTGIFVSYRQADAKAWAIALRDDLAEVFGDDQVFLDKDTLHAGNWREQIQRELERCRVVLIVIGPRWLTITDEQNRPRIQLPDDIHHQEVALALARADVTVIPVLVDEAPMPNAAQLPPDLQKLTDQQARKIGDTQARRKADLGVLIEDIRLVGGIEAKPATTEPRESTPAPTRVGWLFLDVRTLGITFALTLFAAMFAYLNNSPVGGPEILFLLVVFYVVVLATRRLWGRISVAKGRRT